MMAPMETDTSLRAKLWKNAAKYGFANDDGGQTDDEAPRPMPTSAKP